MFSQTTIHWIKPIYKFSFYPVCLVSRTEIIVMTSGFY